ncbi:MAG TPA: glutathione S-transferase family protein [Burkholderiaceae bacterium]|nr:glutathione S-transferase family protein [Burkholderiaceae bacterium]HSC00012.1 glutathione S-transferase family protein [Burkholderiaceae bacterium]
MSASALRLHGFCQSGNTFKAAFGLRAMGLPYEDVLVDFMHGQTRDAAWRAQTNAMGEAPVLDDGPLRLTQSGVILTHLARKTGRFGGRDEGEQREVLRWLLFDNHKFTSYFATYRFMRAFGPVAPDPAVLAFLKSRIDGAYGIVDKHLATRDWLVGDAPTIADFSLSGYLFYPADESGIDVARSHPHIHAWVQRLRALPGWGDPYEVLPGQRIPPRWVSA